MLNDATDQPVQALARIAIGRVDSNDDAPLLEGRNDPFAVPERPLDGSAVDVDNRQGVATALAGADDPIAGLLEDDLQHGAGLADFEGQPGQEPGPRQAPSLEPKPASPTMMSDARELNADHGFT